MGISRRNSEGIYEHVANFTEYATPYASTNGKWVVLSGEGVALFSVDSNNKVSNGSQVRANGGFVLSDDTFVGFDPVSETDDGNFTIRTYQYEASNNTWVNIPGTELVVQTVVSVSGDFTSYRVYDNHLVIADISEGPDNMTVNLYERLVNKSWSFVESIQVNASGSDSFTVLYNGVDTLAFGLLAQYESSSAGAVRIFTKKNGAWSEQLFTPSTLGYTGIAYLGFSGSFVDENSLLFGAAFEGFTGSSSPANIGKVVMFSRTDNGNWEPAVDLDGSTGDVFGVGVGVNDHDIVISSVNLLVASAVTFHTAPRCFYQPINVTCNNQQVTDCADLSSAELYTINNPQCGAVTTNLLGLSLVNNQALEAQFSFTRDFGSTVYCNATITCPAPPVTPTSNNVNNAGVLQLGLASFFVTVVGLLTL
jgi:hypothetical protein